MVYDKGRLFSSLILFFLSKIRQTNLKSAPLIFCPMGRGPGGPPLATALDVVVVVVADVFEAGLIVNVLCDNVGVQIVTLIEANFPICLDDVTGA